MQRKRLGLNVRSESSNNGHVWCKASGFDRGFNSNMPGNLNKNMATRVLRAATREVAVPKFSMSVIFLFLGGAVH
jgi:hypothetical protein